MLVMILRIVTLAAPCLRCSSCTISSGVVSCKARHWSSHSSAGVIATSWSRSRCKSWTANALGQRPDVVLPEDEPDRLRLAPASAQQTVGDRIGLLACCAAEHNALGEAPQILDEHDPQRDRDCPELANGQRLDILVGTNKALQHLEVEAAVGVGDEGPGHTEHAGIACERPVGELRQLPVIAGGEIGADLADLLFDDMKIVDQPFGCGCDRVTGVDGFGDGPVCAEQHGFVVGKAAGQRVPSIRLCCHRLRNSEAPGVLFEALYAEQLFPNRLSAVPKRGARPAPENSGYKTYQWGLSFARLAAKAYTC